MHFMEPDTACSIVMQSCMECLFRLRSAQCLVYLGCSEPQEMKGQCFMSQYLGVGAVKCIPPWGYSRHPRRVPQVGLPPLEFGEIRELIPGIPYLFSGPIPGMRTPIQSNFSGSICNFLVLGKSGRAHSF